MKINTKILLLSAIFICSCFTGSAYASNVEAMDLSFNPAPPFWPGEKVTVTVDVVPIQSGAYVRLQSQLGDYFASGYTDNEGKFSGDYIVPNDAYQWIQDHPPIDSIYFSASCPEIGNGPQANNEEWVQSIDYYCRIVPEKPADPQLPEFPSMVLPVVAIIGLIAVFGRRKE